MIIAKLCRHDIASRKNLLFLIVSIVLLIYEFTALIAFFTSMGNARWHKKTALDIDYRVRIRDDIGGMP